MPKGADEYDKIAHALVEATVDFDAVEKGGLRAEWTDEGRQVTVGDMDTDETVVYSADDLALATSEREVENARQPKA